MTTDKKPFNRLPTNVVPTNYDVKLSPDLEKFTFDGQMTVSLKIAAETTTMVMNSFEIEVQSASFQHENGSNNKATKIELDAKEQTLTLTFPTTLKTGSGKLSMNFTGILNDKMCGFYRSKQTVNGVEKPSACTQFEPTDARRCFPCWDEPAIKATFDCTLVVPKHLVALSNMSIVKECEDESDSNKKVCTYARTPIMSTYLLAFVIGEYDFVEGQSKHGVKIRIYTPPGRPHQGEYALKVSIQALDYFTDYFNIPFPLDKLDCIGIADFAAGAMENWGLITYRETAILIDPATSSSANYQRVDEVICHEIAHQWFGNLVTMEWWTHLWLNEGFANFMQYKVGDVCEPNFKLWEQYPGVCIHRAMILDEMDSSHPIEVPVGHPDEVHEIFDAISYCKGSSIIRQMHYWIGPEAFKTGLQNYLKEFSYKNAVTEDLWSALGAASGKPVEEVMTTWTKQMGYPVLDVSIKSSTDNSVTLSIKQSKYGSANDAALWQVPIIFCTSKSPSEPHQTFLMTSKTAEVTIENLPANGRWIKLNQGYKGFYRVNYSSDLIKNLLPAVQSKQLPAIDRLNIINDLCAMSQCGIISPVEYLNAVRSFENEREYTILKDISDGLTEMKYRIGEDNTKTIDLLEKFASQIFSNVFSALGWEKTDSDDILTSQLRSLALLHCNTQENYEKCQKMVLNKMNGVNNSMAVDMETSVYKIYTTHGGKDAFCNMTKMHKEAESQQEQERILSSFRGCTSEDIFDDVVKYIMSDHVRDNIRPFGFSFLGDSSRAQRLRVWNFVKQNFELFLNKYEGNPLLSRLIQMTTNKFGSSQAANDVKTFFEEHPAPGAERVINQSIEKISHRADWWSKAGQDVTQWFNNNVAIEQKQQ